jgi:hypothetical protein
MIDMILAIVCQIGYATIDTDSLKKLIRARSCTRALAFTHLKVSYLAFTAPPETLAQSHAPCSLESAGRPLPARTLARDRFQNSRLRSSMRKPIRSLVTCSNDRRCHFRLHHYRHGLPRQSLHRPCYWLHKASSRANAIIMMVLQSPVASAVQHLRPTIFCFCLHRTPSVGKLRPSNALPCA